MSRTTRELCDVDCEVLGEPALAARCDPVTDLVDDGEQPLFRERVGERDRGEPGEMVVAGARRSERSLFRGERARFRRRGGDEPEHLERVRHVAVCEPVVAMPTLLSHRDQTARAELREVQARRRRREIGCPRELAGGQGLPAEEREQHRCARGLTDERRDIGEGLAARHEASVAPPERRRFCRRKSIDVPERASVSA